MEKYLVTVEFRHKFDSTTITLSICDSFDEACHSGNHFLEGLESRFDLHVFSNGQQAEKERFSVDGGCFGEPKTLISNLAYIQTPFTFYAKITTLRFADINETIGGLYGL